MPSSSMSFPEETERALGDVNDHIPSLTWGGLLKVVTGQFQPAMPCPLVFGVTIPTIMSANPAPIFKPY